MEKSIKLFTFQKLIEICVNKKDDKELLLKHIKENIKEESILDNLLDFTVTKDINFLLNVDVAQGFYPNEWIELETNSILKDQFPNLKIKLPNFKNYNIGKFVNIEQLKDYDNKLREHKLQYSYIKNVEDFEYLTIIHEISKKKELQELFNKIEYKLFEY